MALMGVDIGSTNMKCVVIAPDGRLLSLAKAPSSLLSLSPDGRKYCDGEKLFQSIAQMCEQAWRTVQREKLDGLAVTGVGCAGILLDARDKQTFFSDIKPMVEPMPGLGPEQYRDICGYPKSYILGIHSLAQYISENPDAERESLSLLSVGDYVNFRLTGIKKRDRSTAGSVALLDRKTSGNWLDFLSAHNVAEYMLPPLCQSGDYIGDLAFPEEIGLPVGTPVFAGGQDYLCASFAAGCVGAGDIVNVLGTFELVSSFFDAPQHTAEASGFSTFMDHHVYPGRHTVTAEMFSAGRIEELFNREGKSGVMSRLFDELNTQSTTRTDWDPGSLADAIVSLNLDSAKRLDYLHKVTGEAAPHVKVVGGGGASRFWIQNKADVTGLTFHVPLIPEAAAAGAALLAGVGSGVYASHEQAARTFESAETAVYHPDPKMTRHYEQYRKRERQGGM